LDHLEWRRAGRQDEGEAQMNRTMSYTVGLALLAGYLLGLIVGNTMPVGSFDDGLFRSKILIAASLALAGAVVGASYLKKQIGQNRPTERPRQRHD
jgi:hypothetical protein